MTRKTELAQTATGIGFQPTAWTVILDSGNSEALEKLCKTYWPPIYSFLRRTGHPPEAAKDLTQGFFLHLLEKERLKSVNPTKGKFRSFLLACLNNFVRDEWEKGRAQKRGGGMEFISVDMAESEQLYGVDPADPQDPAKIFDQRWARVVLYQALEELKKQCSAHGKGEQFATLLPYLTGENARGDYATAAEKLGMSEGAIRVAVSRLRDEFRKVLVAEVSRTVVEPEEIEGEIRYLFEVFHKS